MCRTFSKENPAIRIDLRPYLTQKGTHPEFQKRGIGAATCDYLGCGFLESSHSAQKGRLHERVVFQVRGVQEDGRKQLKPTVLSHIGRAITAEQQKEGGKWSHYAGFKKSLELYNLDNLLLDERARVQAQRTRSILLVEGCFDVAKCIEAGLAHRGNEEGIFNVVASFGAHLSANQVSRLQMIAEQLGVNRFRICFDRDSAGLEGQKKAIATITKAGFEATGFDWNQALPAGKQIPDTINDVCEFSVKQLQWLRRTDRI